jgi:hypothetical protein
MGGGSPPADSNRSLQSHLTTNQATNMKTTVILFRIEKTWELASYSGGAIPSTPPFATATAARIYASLRGWSVRRASDCDE